MLSFIVAIVGCVLLLAAFLVVSMAMFDYRVYIGFLKLLFWVLCAVALFGAGIYLIDLAFGVGRV